MTAHFQDDTTTLYAGHAATVLATLPVQSADCIVTSPPYFGLRSYGDDPDEMGTEETPAEFVEALVVLFREARRVLADDGTLWLNLGDSYSSGNGPRTMGRNDAGRDIGGRGGNREGSGNPGAQGSRMATGQPPPKNLIGIPWRVAFALQDDGWILRNDIIWAKPNGMPESVTDRLSNKHEHVFMFSKKPRYWFNLDPIREAPAGEYLSSGVRNPRFGRPGGMLPGEIQGKAKLHPSSVASGSAHSITSASHENGRNPGDVWMIPTSPFPGAHFATMPPALAERCIQAGCKPGGTVLDPFSGSGTTGLAASRHGMKYVGIDLYATNHDLALSTRLAQDSLLTMEHRP